LGRIKVPPMAALVLGSYLDGPPSVVGTDARLPITLPAIATAAGGDGLDLALV
jgi:hypothetical protein